MYDPEWRVRTSAINATGEIRSIKAVDSLIDSLNQSSVAFHPFHIYGALGAIGDERAIPYLIEGLQTGPGYDQQSALNALMKIDPGTSIDHAILELQDEDVHVRRNAVIVCLQAGDSKVVEPLKGVFNDEDFEVRFYAKQAVKRIQKLQ